ACCRPADHGGRKLLDVANEPGCQPGPNRLAPGDAGPWTVDVLCACECRGLPLYTTAVARSGCRSAQSAAQRGRQRRDLDGADHSGAPRPVSHLASWRIPRFFQCERCLLLRSGPWRVPAADRRPGRRAAARLASAGEFTAATGIVT